MIEALLTGLLVFARVAALLSRLPAFSARGAPRSVVVVTSLGVSLILLGGVPRGAVPTTLEELLVALAGEILFGLFTGAGVEVAFAAIAIGTEIASVQAGFANATLFNPLEQQSSHALSILASWVAGTGFLALGLHLRCLEIVCASFEHVPPGSVASLAGAPFLLIQGVGASFGVGVQLAGPVAVLVFGVNLLTGLLGRLAPRANAFFAFGATLTSIAGLSMFAISLPWMVEAHAQFVARAVHALGSR